MKTGVSVLKVSRRDRNLHGRRKRRRWMTTKITPINKDPPGQMSEIHSSPYLEPLKKPLLKELSSGAQPPPIQTMRKLAIARPEHEDRYQIVPMATSPTISWIPENRDKKSLISLSVGKTTEKYEERQSKRGGQQDLTNINNDNAKKPHRNMKVQLIDMEDRRPQQRRMCRICSVYSNYCCLVSVIGIILLLAGITALLLYISTRTTTTTTTSGTSATTSNTSTSSTSTTSTTATISTTTAPCTPISVGSASILYSTTSGTGMTYTYHTYEWTSPTTGSVELAFQFRNDPNYWYLDDVSVYAGASQMLTNGGFETGSLSPWVRTTPNGACFGAPGQVSSSSPRTGSKGYYDGCTGAADQVAQSFMATAGQMYNVSFWLKSGGTGSCISALVTLS